MEVSLLYSVTIINSRDFPHFRLISSKIVQFSREKRPKNRMDVDDDNLNDDVDGKLARQFNRIATRDRDTLIDDFRQILNADGGLPSPQSDDGDRQRTCTFFLDMNDWNLQAALGSFYDFNAGEMLETPKMSFVQDVTVGEGQSVAPSTKFLKTWRVRNSGGRPWPQGCVLKRCSGDAIKSASDEILVESVPSEHCTDISVEMMSPSIRGTFHSMWRLMTRQEVPFGDHIWCIITVEDSGLLDLTQKLAATEMDDDDREEENNNCRNFSL